MTTNETNETCKTNEKKYQTNEKKYQPNRCV